MIINNISSGKMELTKLLQLFWATQITLLIVAIQRIYLSHWGQALTLFIAQVSLISVYYYAKKGQLKLASIILLSFLTALILGFVWKYGGLRDEVLLVFPAIIMYSMLLGSKRFALYIYIFISTNIFIIGYLNQFGVMHHTVNDSSMSSAVLIIIILTLISYAIYLLSSEITQSNLALRKSKEELEQRVIERTAELQQSLDNLTNTQSQLIESEKMASLGRLVAGVAHEINTPLGVAITASSYLENITENFNDNLNLDNVSKSALIKHNKSILESTRLISTNLSRAEHLVDNFKEVAIDHSSGQLRIFNLKDYLTEILANLAPTLKNKQTKVELFCEPDIEIYNDPGALSQVITNLYVNAVQHGFIDDQDGIISIIVNKDDQLISILFMDSGQGMSKESTEQVFEPFYTTKRNHGASGLGMHIAYNLVTQSLNGTISCSSKVDEGTQFELQFPNKSATDYRI